MRRKRRRRKRNLKTSVFIAYDFENLKINSFVQLTDTQVDLIHSSVKDIISHNKHKKTYQISKQILVQMKGVVSAVQCDSETLYFIVTINHRYLDLLK